MTNRAFNAEMSAYESASYGVEMALQLVDNLGEGEVTLVSMAPDNETAGLRTALAMGADRAIQVDANGPVQPLTAARALLALAGRESPGLVILGKQAIDDDNNQTGQMLAGLWDRPQATFASKVVLDGDTRITSYNVCYTKLLRLEFNRQ